MSYPKKHPVSLKDSERDSKFSQRRDQLKNLLVTKFRGKFGVTGATDTDWIDNTIRAEVETFLNNEQMTEANLIKLDRKLTEQITGKSGSRQRQQSVSNTQRVNEQSKQHSSAHA